MLGGSVIVNKPEQGPPAAPPNSPAAGDGRRALREALVVFLVAIALCAVFLKIPAVSKLIHIDPHTLIAIVFLYLPTLILLKRREDFGAYGLTFSPLGRGLRLFAVTSLIVFPLFAVGLYGFYSLVCAAVHAGCPIPLPLRAMCSRFVGNWQRARLRLPSSLGRMALSVGNTVLAELVVIALPEEYFFRGYLQSRLEVRWPSRRRLLGAPVGPALVLSSVLFALGHPLVDFNPLRLVVFFPGLIFGWMRQATGSIVAGVLFHAACNLYSMLLHAMLF